MLDVRKHRDAWHQANTSKTLLGREQKESVKQFLLGPGTFKFLVSPVPWSARMIMSDGWSGYLTEREEILDFIVENNIKGVVLLSGDTHFVSITEMRNGLVEFSASPIHSIPLSHSTALWPEDRVITHPVHGTKIEDKVVFRSDLSNGYGMYFGTVEVDTQAEDPWYTVEIRGYNLDPANPVVVHTRKQYLSGKSEVYSRDDSEKIDL
eukprot:TRINITY_DN6889_c0_g1_i1.p1 TRINITY_DN6889_c0_g1~~TRINITY_DN6889_c0_g1_i1.p1  ORF type:complete len:208 (+),score=28.22 TRINITY_DN6889_c0_g1_i1:119-742(+)